MKRTSAIIEWERDADKRQKHKNHEREAELTPDVHSTAEICTGKALRDDLVEVHGSGEEEHPLHCEADLGSDRRQQQALGHWRPAVAARC